MCDKQNYEYESDLSLLRGHNLSYISKDFDTKKITYKCNKCGFVDSRTPRSIKACREDTPCKSCSKIAKDNEIVREIIKFTKEKGGTTDTHESYEKRSKRWYGVQTKFQVKICKHINPITLDLIKKGVSGKCYRCSRHRSFKEDDEIIRDLAHVGIKTEACHISESRNPLMIKSFVYKCGCIGSNKSFSGLANGGGLCKLHSAQSHSRISEDGLLEIKGVATSLFGEDSYELFYKNGKGHMMIKAQCVECGDSFQCEISSFMSKARCKCRRCTGYISNGEHLVIGVLNNMDRNFIPEKTFKDLKGEGNYPLRFDFYVENSYIIEFDGQHHYEQVMNWNVEKVQMNDDLKNKYCKDNDIPILRISYRDIKRCEEMIKDFDKAHLNKKEDLINV